MLSEKPAEHDRVYEAWLQGGRPRPFDREAYKERYQGTIDVASIRIRLRDPAT